MTAVYKGSRCLFLLIPLITLAFLPAVIAYSQGYANICAGGQEAVSEAENSFNLAYESVVSIELRGLDSADLFSRLNQSLSYLMGAKAVLEVNESQAIELADLSKNISMEVYSDSQMILSSYQNWSETSALIFWFGLALSLIFIILLAYYLVSYLKGRSRKLFLEMRAELSEEK